MLYRKLGNCKQEVSVLGFGCMRLPVVGGTGKAADIWDPNKPIDDPLAIDMIQYAVDQGVNYFDTAFIYHGGKSEVVARRRERRGQIRRPRRRGRRHGGDRCPRRR